MLRLPAAFGVFALFALAAACASETHAPELRPTSVSSTTPSRGTATAWATAVQSPYVAQPTLRTIAGDIDGYEYTLEVADDPDERTKGLSGRTFIYSNYGMLFVWEEAAEYTLWMKEMRFALDFVWLDADRRVVHIERGVQPQPGATDSELVQYPSQKPAKYAIEFEAGAAARRGVDVGEVIQFDERLITGTYTPPTATASASP